jgi:hypothetical protein
VEHASFLSAFGAHTPASFAQRRVFVGAGAARAYDPDEWTAAFVVVEYGRIELAWSNGGRLSFGPGDLLSLAGLALRALHNPGPLPALLVVIRRRATVEEQIQ